ncbi:MAG: DoxX family protein [Candidatus Aminicenantales bacterium]
MTKPSLVAKWESWAPRLRSILRIAAALIFMSAGTMKLFGFPARPAPNPGAIKLLSQMGLAGILETFGGTLLLLGLFTRPIAFVLSGEMAVAYFQVHFARGFWPATNGGMAAALFCFVWLYFSAAGPGPWSLDAWRRKRPASS